MANVVYANVYDMDELSTVEWSLGDQHSYEFTQRMAENLQGIKLIGRQDKTGQVQIVQVMAHRGKWLNVNRWHLMILKWFSEKLECRPPGPDLKEFIDLIDSPDVRSAIQQIVWSECGTEGSGDETSRSVRGINATLRALGLPAGDWSYVPMLDTVQRGLAPST